MSDTPTAPEEEFTDRKHLQRLRVAFKRPPIYFVTITVLDRRKALVDHGLAPVVVSALEEASQMNGWLVGRYVIMPDHVHFFCGAGASVNDLSKFVGCLKALSTRHAWAEGWHGRLWQKEFHDHLLRSAESYEQKWHYVLENPVRAGLCREAEEWPYQGEMEVL